MLGRGVVFYKGLEMAKMVILGSLFRISSKKEGKWMKAYLANDGRFWSF
jgi:hypothetical protein